jgi:hemoglobin-like flavoprotein
MHEPQPLSADDIARVRASFDRFWSLSAGTAELFYRHLFELAPDVRPLFQADMLVQQRKFMATLATIVGNLDNEIALSAAAALAKHHVDYGVRPDHYSFVGQSLLWSLEHTLGEEWTPEVAASWSKAYALVSDHMLRTAYR